MCFEYKLLRDSIVPGCTLALHRAQADNPGFGTRCRWQTMVRKVVVSFGAERGYSFEVGDKDLLVLTAEDAREWLAEGFGEAGCEPSNPMGKVLAADLLLGVARAAGEARFADASPWRAHYGAAALRLREANELLVDVAAYEVRVLA
jgi:hypothetical protein